MRLLLLVLMVLCLLAVLFCLVVLVLLVVFLPLLLDVVVHLLVLVLVLGLFVVAEDRHVPLPCEMAGTIVAGIVVDSFALSLEPRRL